MHYYIYIYFVFIKRHYCVIRNVIFILPCLVSYGLFSDFRGQCAGFALFRDNVSSWLLQPNLIMPSLSSQGPHSHHYNATPALIWHFCISTRPVCIRFTSVHPILALGISSLSAYFYANLFKKSSHNTCAFYFLCSRNRIGPSEMLLFYCSYLISTAYIAVRFPWGLHEKTS